MRSWRRWLSGDDAGTAIIEFIFVAVLMLVPLVYFLAAVASVQRSQLAVTEAARNAGRAYATSNTEAEASVRARAAVRLALSDQGLPDDATLTYSAAYGRCGASSITPQLRPGAEFTVCVVRHTQPPWVPKALTGGGIVSTGVYVVHVDDFRSAAG